MTVFYILKSPKIQNLWECGLKLCRCRKKLSYEERKLMSGNEVTHYPLKWISYSSKSDRELHNNTFCFKLAQEESNMNEMRKE